MSITIMMNIIGKVLCGWVTQPGDIQGKPELQEAYALGRSIQ